MRAAGERSGYKQILLWIDFSCLGYVEWDVQVIRSDLKLLLPVKVK